MVSGGVSLPSAISQEPTQQTNAAVPVLVRIQCTGVPRKSDFLIIYLITPLAMNIIISPMNII
jgi:hypothetical protein